MRIATLNIQHGGGTRTKAIFDYMQSLDVDCFVVTEYRINDKGLSKLLHDIGFAFQLSCNVDVKINTVLIASKAPFDPLEISQRIVSVDFGNLILAGVYFPAGRGKCPVFEKAASIF